MIRIFRIPTPLLFLLVLSSCSTTSSISTPEEIPGAVLSGTISTDSSSALTTKTQISGGTVYALDLTSGEVITAPLEDDGTFSVELTAEQTDDDLILIVTDTSGVVTAVLEFNYGDNATSTVPLPDAGISGEYNLGDFTVDSSSGTASAGSENDLGDTVLSGSGETIVPGQMTPLAAGYTDTDGNNIPDILDALIGQTFDSSSYSTPLATFRVVDCFCAAGMGYYSSNCDPDDGIICGLTRALDTSTLASTSVTADLSDGTDVPVTFTNDSLFGSGNTLAITPTSCPAGDTTFVMTTALFDTDGNALAEVYEETFTFTGGDASCNDTIPLPTPPPFLSGFGTTDADYDGIPDADDNYPARPNMNQMPPRPPNFAASCLAALGGNIAICCSSGVLNSSLTADQQTCCSGICPGSIPGAIANAFGGAPLRPPRVAGAGGVTCPPGQTMVGNLCIIDTRSGTAPSIGTIPGGANDTAGCQSDAACGPGGLCNSYTKTCNYNNNAFSGSVLCGSSLDCGSGATCSAGGCVSTTSCSGNSACRNPYPICASGVCSPCSSSSQCPASNICDGVGSCIPSAAVTDVPSTGICPTGTALIAGACVANTSIPNAPVNPDATAALPSGAVACGDRTCSAPTETTLTCPSDCGSPSTTAPSTTTTGTTAGLNGACTIDSGCQTGLFCGGIGSSGRVCKTIGQGQNGIDSCTQNSFCASGNCAGGICQAALSALNGTCTSDSGCASGLFCGGTSSSRVCKTNGQGASDVDTCSANTQCASGLCSGTCMALLPSSVVWTMPSLFCGANIAGGTMTLNISNQTATSFTITSSNSGPGMTLTGTRSGNGCTITMSTATSCPVTRTQSCTVSPLGGGTHRYQQTGGTECAICDVTGTGGISTP